MDKTIEQQARELLAEEVKAVGRSGYEHIVASEAALRAIARALTRPAPTEAEVEAAVARMAETPVHRGDFETVRAGEILSASELSGMARAALGIES